MSTQHYAEFYFARSFTSDLVSMAVDNQGLSGLEWPDRAYAVRFYSRTETESDGEILVGKRRDVSPVTYRYGTVRTIDEVRESMPGSILLRNMEGNGWDKVVDCAQGTLPFMEGDTVLEPMPS